MTQNRVPRCPESHWPVTGDWCVPPLAVILSDTSLALIGDLVVTKALQNAEDGIFVLSWAHLGR